MAFTPASFGPDFIGGGRCLHATHRLALVMGFATEDDGLRTYLAGGDVCSGAAGVVDHPPLVIARAGSACASHPITPPLLFVRSRFAVSQQYRIGATALLLIWLLPLHPSAKHMQCVPPPPAYIIRSIGCAVLTHRIVLAKQTPPPARARGRAVSSTCPGGAGNAADAGCPDTRHPGYSVAGCAVLTRCLGGRRGWCGWGKVGVICNHVH
jgi:hypothetical protein